MNTELKDIRLDEIRPSKTNPRKDFESPAAKAYLDELAGTIRERGVKQPVLVRPDYCIGTSSKADIDAKRRDPVFWVLIAGECRLRASKIAGKEALPCLVEEATDDDARETQQIENLQRRDLSPLEEAEGFQQMLDLKDDAGKPRYTVEALATRVGRDVGWIYKRVALLQLPPGAREAMGSGLLLPKVAGLIATVFGPAREHYAKAVIKPPYGEGPLTFRAAKELKEREYMRSLKGAPFPLEDAQLLAAAGACTGCPKMSANCAHLFDADDKQAHLKQRSCMDPACYQKKLDALHARQAAAAEKEGKKLLTRQESEKIYYPYGSPGEMSYSSPYVDIARAPEEHLLKKEVKKPGSWKKLVETAEEKTGAKVPRILAHDQNGTLRELVDIKLAIAAIEKAGEPIFRDAKERGSPGRSSNDDWKKQQARERERRDADRAVCVEVLRAIAAKVQASKAAAGMGGPIVDVFAWFAHNALSRLSDDGAQIICARRGIELTKGKSGSKEVEKVASQVVIGPELLMLALELEVCEDVFYSGPKDESLVGLAELFEVDIDKIDKTTRATLKAAKDAAKKPKKPHKFAVGDVVEWESGGAMKQGVIVTDAEYQEKMSCKSPVRKGESIAVRITKTHQQHDLPYNGIRIDGLTLIKAAPEMTDGKVQAVVTLLAANKPREKIAQQLGLALEQVDAVAAQQKPAKSPAAKKPAKKAKRAVINDDTRSQVRRLVEAGKTGAEIAKEVGISLPSVQSIKKALGFVKERAAQREKGVAAK